MLNFRGVSKKMTLGATSRGLPRVPRWCRRTHGVGTVAGTVARAERFKRKTQWGHPAVGWKFKGFKGFDSGGVQFLGAIATRDVERKYEQKQPKTCNLFLESCSYFSVSTI